MQDMEVDDVAIGIAGAGVMGAGIAQVAVTNGLRAVLFDTRDGAAAAARDQIGKRLSRLVEKGRMSTEEASAATGRIAVAGDLGDLAQCGVVIEAIVEKLDVKIGLFRELEKIVAPDTILATNTSSFPIGAIAAGLTHKDRVAGMHFFNPVPLMRLVEVTPAPDTRAEVVERLTALALRMGREPVTVADTPGFLVNFGGRAYTTEALTILQEQVAGPAEIDAVMRDAFGFRMGPFELMDLTGMDVNYPVTEFVHRAMFGDPRLRSTARHKYMLDTGQLGRKSGRGFFRYGEDAEQPAPDASSPAAPAASVFVADGQADLVALLRSCGAELLEADDGKAPILVAPLGEDCCTVAARTGLDARRLVACDMLGDVSKRLTIMTAPGADPDIRDSVIALLSRDRAVTAIADSPGFVGQRIMAMVANLGCEMAQMGLADPRAIDKAMRLGLNYPLGPLELAEEVGPAQVHAVLTAIQAQTGDDRYRPSPWLRRRAQIGVPIHTV